MFLGGAGCAALLFKKRASHYVFGLDPGLRRDDEVGDYCFDPGLRDDEVGEVLL